MQVQEGIIVDANPSWLELFGIVASDGLLGQPIMDLFEESKHAALKGALAACLQGRWSDHTLQLNAVLPDGTVLPDGDGAHAGRARRRAVRAHGRPRTAAKMRRVSLTISRTRFVAILQPDSCIAVRCSKH